MKIFTAADHAGFDLKEELKKFLSSLGHEVVDCGAAEYDEQDDYPQFILTAAKLVAEDPKNSRGIVIGASGQGEAMAANRIKGVRAALFYGNPSVSQTDASGNVLDLLTSTRKHNDANVLSLGARFITFEEAKAAVELWLATDFSGETRHLRRIKQIDDLA